MFARSLRANFNSIKVQLELIDLVLVVFMMIFQFHKGTIRTTVLFEHSATSIISIP